MLRWDGTSTLARYGLSVCVKLLHSIISFSQVRITGEKEEMDQSDSFDEELLVDELPIPRKNDAKKMKQKKEKKKCCQ